MIIEKKCCFTGHRPKSLPFGYNENEPACKKLKEQLMENIERQITDNGVTHFVSGMAMGVDIYAAEAVLELKKKYPNITLECVILCETQANDWSESWRDRYFDIIIRSDDAKTLQTHYSSGCMRKRNEYMVDNSDVVIAVWNGKKGGTGGTVEYALKNEKNVVIIDPNKLC